MPGLHLFKHQRFTGTVRSGCDLQRVTGRNNLGGKEPQNPFRSGPSFAEQLHRRKQPRSVMSLLGAFSGHILSISKERNSTASLGNLLQCLTALIVGKNHPAL